MKIISIANLKKQIETFDHSSMRAIEKWRSTPLTWFLKVLTYSGTGKTWLLVSLSLTILHFKRIVFVPKQVFFMRSLFAPLIAWAIGTILKKVFSRQRPYQRIENYTAQISSPHCNSFPSSHTSSSMAFFFALALGHHPLALAVGLWASLVTFSRYYLGVHFPSDLLGGMVLGLICGIGIGCLFVA